MHVYVVLDHKWLEIVGVFTDHWEAQEIAQAKQEKMGTKFTVHQKLLN